VFGVFISKDDVKSVMKKFDTSMKSVYKGDPEAQLDQLELFCDEPLRGRHAISATVTRPTAEPEHILSSTSPPPAASSPLPSLPPSAAS
jgi:hypothetical protein